MLTIDTKPTEYVCYILEFLISYLTSRDSPEEVLRAQKKKICSLCTIDASQPFMVDGSQWEVHRHSRLHRARAIRAAKLRGKKKGARPVKRNAKDTSKEVGTSDAKDISMEVTTDTKEQEVV